MTTASRLTQTLLVTALTLAATSAAFAQRPDLNGTFTNMSLTGLTRPEGVEPLVVNADLAQQIADGTPIAGIAPGDFDESAPAETPDGAPPAGSIDFGLRGYNSFWTDPGSQLANVMGEFRTSYIIDPPNGQIPRLEEPLVDLNRKSFGYRYLTGIGDNSGPEALPLAERCLIGFGNTAGPGMMGTLYNSTYQFVQTDEYVTILVEMAHDARIIPTFDSEEEALALANATKYGLAATLWTSNLQRAHRMAHELEAGIVWINSWLVRDLRTPFGGVKQSGLGREGGFEALRFFTEPKNVFVKL